MNWFDVSREYRAFWIAYGVAFCVGASLSIAIGIVLGVVALRYLGLWKQ